MEHQQSFDVMQHEYFRPLDIAETFGRVFSIFAEKWCLFLGINLISNACMVIIAFFSFFLLLATFDFENLENGNWMVVVTIELFIFACVQCIADGACIRAVVELYAGRVPQMLVCFAEIKRKVGSLLIACLLIFLFVGLIPFAVSYILLRTGSIDVMVVIVAVVLYALYVISMTLLLYHTYPAIIVEDLDAFAGLGRSISMASGSLCYTFPVLLLFYLMKFFINTTITSLSTTAFNTIDTDSGVKVDINFGGLGDSIISFLVKVVLLSLGAIFQAVIYLNIRIEKEGLTKAQLCRELGFEEEVAYTSMDDAEKERPQPSTELV